MHRIWDKSNPPRGPFTLNRDCPQAQGLVCWYPFGMAGSNYLADQAGTLHLAGTANPKLNLGPYGEPVCDFVRASTQYYSATKVPIAALPLSIVGWFNSNDLTTNQDICSLSTSGVAGKDRYQLLFAGAAGGDPVGVVAANPTTTELATAGGYTANTWAHAVAVFASTTNRIAYFNGVAGTANTNANTVTLPTVTSIGAVWFDNAITNAFSGSISQVGIYNTAIDAGIVQRLYDPGNRFELWYPLRSKKWISIAAGSFKAAWARNANSVIQGMRA